MAKYTADSDSRTPSIRNIVAGLQEPIVLDTLRETYAIWRLPSVEEENDPAIVEALGRMEAREESERRLQFDKHHDDLVVSWSKLAALPALDGFRTIRDKLTAHTEIRLVADKYQPVDIGTLGFQWGDLKRCIVKMQHCVELIGFIVRNAGFAWDMLDRQLTEAAHGFWSSPEAAS